METSQNFPNTDPRIPKIIEERLEGKNWEQVGDSVGLTRRAIYNIRQKDEFRYILDTLAPKVDKMFEEILEGESISYRIEAGKEINRMRRALITRRTSHTEDIKLTADLTITEKRKEKESLVKSLELTEDQYKILDAQFKTNEKEEG